MPFPQATSICHRYGHLLTPPTTGKGLSGTTSGSWDYVSATECLPAVYEALRSVPTAVKGLSTKDKKQYLGETQERPLKAVDPAASMLEPAWEALLSLVLRGPELLGRFFGMYEVYEP